MTRMIRVLACVAALTIAASSYAQTRDPRASASAPTTPTGTGALSGSVVADDSSQPLRQASVVLIGATTGALKVTATDADGRFAFDALPVDVYTVAASKQPYLGALAGAKRPARPGSAIVVANGQRVTGVTIRLPKAAVITGTITDEFGQPVPGAVSVQRRQMRNGDLTFVPVKSNVVTDEAGRYRIWGLAPGDYIVSATRMFTPAYKPRQLTDTDVDAALRAAGAVDTGATLSPSSPVERAGPTFYPGTPRADEATVLTLTVGEERTGIDIRSERVVSVQVEGTVKQPDGQPPTRAMATIMSAGSSGTFTRTLGVGPDGRFVAFNLEPGRYVISVRTLQNLSALVAVDASGGDVTGVSMTLSPAMMLTGRVVFEGTNPPSPSGVSVPLTPLRSVIDANVNGPGVRPTVAPSDRTGAFRVTDIIPGRYVFGGAVYLGPNTTTTTWALQSVMAGERDITDLPVDLTAETLPKELVVTFTDKWQSVSGKLQTSQGQPASDYTVVAFPADKNYWTFGTRRILTARPASDGSFTIGGSGIASLPPGQYVLAAVTDISKDEQFDPALLNQLLAAGTPITIAPGERKVQDLVIR